VNTTRRMQQIGLVLTLALAMPAFALAAVDNNNGNGNGGGGNRGVNGRRGSATFLANNPLPVLIYTVWGLDNTATTGPGTGGGSNGVGSGSDVSSVVVYDNGMATWSQNHADGTNTSRCSGQCSDTVFLTATQLNQLVSQLNATDWRHMRSDAQAGSGDTNLTTVTFFRFLTGTTETATTISFYNSQATSGRLGNLQAALNGFLSTNWGSSNINGTGNGNGNGGGTGGGR